MWWEAAPGLDSHLAGLKGLRIGNEKEDAAGEQLCFFFFKRFPSEEGPLVPHLLFKG